MQKSVPVTTGSGRRMKEVVAENAVVVFGREGCCMCHVAKLLLYGHGANPAVVHVDGDQDEAELSEITADAGVLRFPVVFVGGAAIGGLEEVMGAHISGELVPKLREARALWL